MCTINKNGFGIGTTTPNFPFVATGTSNNYTINTGSYSYTYAGQYGNAVNYTPSIVAYINGNVLTPSAYIAFSDERIKKKLKN